MSKPNFGIFEWEKVGSLWLHQKRRHLLSGWVRQTRENYTNPWKHLGQNLTLSKALISSTACSYEKPIAAARMLHKSACSRFSAVANIHVSAPTDLCDWAGAKKRKKKSGSCMVCVQQCCCGIYVWQIVSAVHAHCEWQNGGCQYILHVRHHNHRAAKNRGTVFIALPQKLCGVITAHLLRPGVLPGLAVTLLPYLAE